MWVPMWYNPMKSSCKYSNVSFFARAECPSLTTALDFRLETSDVKECPFTSSAGAILADFSRALRWVLCMIILSAWSTWSVASQPFCAVVELQTGQWRRPGSMDGLPGSMQLVLTGRAFLHNRLVTTARWEIKSPLGSAHTMKRILLRPSISLTQRASSHLSKCCPAESCIQCGPYIQHYQDGNRWFGSPSKIPLYSSLYLHETGWYTNQWDAGLTDCASAV